MDAAKEIGAELRRNIYSIISLGLVAVGVYAYFKAQAKAAAAALPTPEQLGMSLKQIVAGAPRYAVEVVSGNGENTYITQTQADQMARANLERKRVIAAQAAAQ